MNKAALYHLATVRIKQYIREPEAMFWAYGFPLIMAIVLGLAFRNQPEETTMLTVCAGESTTRVSELLADDKRFDVKSEPEAEALERLRKNKTPIVVRLGEDGAFEYLFDPSNPEARKAHAAIDDALQRAAGRTDAVVTRTTKTNAPGSRYIDFLIPGLIGMNIMGSGLWGVGFNLVDMRIRNLLKRLIATPMRRTDFLISMVGMRVMFFIPEMTFLLLAAYLIFDIPIRGSLFAIMFLATLGSVAFAGLGMLTACRAKRIESISGLMNLVMMPMWLTSGIFFSSERFPDLVQPLIQALPLTQLINALRAIMLDGEALASQAIPILILSAWALVTFTLALKWFRWNE
ncbi:MAG: ABC transporter permease [Planctomycetota bacterium]|jgi:ABC-type multidrug transport system permease subunit